MHELQMRVGRVEAVPPMRCELLRQVAGGQTDAPTPTAITRAAAMRPATSSSAARSISRAVCSIVRASWKATLRTMSDRSPRVELSFGDVRTFQVGGVARQLLRQLHPQRRKTGEAEHFGEAHDRGLRDAGVVGEFGDGRADDGIGSRSTIVPTRDSAAQTRHGRADRLDDVAVHVASGLRQSPTFHEIMLHLLGIVK
jgi:hypothetical protein